MATAAIVITQGEAATLNKPMKSTATSSREPRVALAAISALLLAFNANNVRAQQAPGPNPATPQSSTGSTQDKSNAAEETIVLSPFEVSSSKDEGYVATSSLAGSRLNTQLKDIASPISVITPQFLQDTGARSVQDLLIYTTNTQVVGPRGNIFLASAGDFNGQNQILYRPQQQTRVRGLNQADLTRDFWVTNVPLDAYNISGIEIQRGPNSILYGLGSPAGIINYTLKTPIMTKDAYVVEARYDSNGGIRASADLNKVIIPDDLAIRVEGLDDHQKFEQSGTYDKIKRITVSPRWTPKIADSVYTEFTLNYESGQDRANRPILTPPVDDIATWYIPAVNKFLRPTSFSPNPAAGGAQASVIPYIGNYNGGSNQWYDQIAVLFSDPNSSKTGGTGLPDALRQRGSGNASRPNSNWEYITNIYDTWNPANPLNQKATFANNPRVMAIINDYETKSGRAFGGFQGWQAKQVLDTSVFDYWHDSLTGDNNHQWSNFHTLDLSARQTYFNGRAGVEFVYDKQNYKDGYENNINDGYTLQIDINQLQPNGQPNPNVGRPEIVSGTNAFWANDKAENSRVTGFYKLRMEDLLKKKTWLDRVIGEQTFTGVFTSQRATHDDYSYLLDDWGDQVGYVGYQPMIEVHYLNTAVAPSSLSTEHGLGIKGVNAVQV
ncbi:MAG TPA: TonB-dependent receptor plug domain-containing protein, partial [Opitutaceae bacterium]